MMRGEKGISLLETILALAVLGIISATFLGATASTSSSRVIADERASAKILAESLMETVKKENYLASYNITVPAEFTGYTANISVEENNNIQDILICVQSRGREIYSLESLKVNRE